MTEKHVIRTGASAVIPPWTGEITEKNFGKYGKTPYRDYKDNKISFERAVEIWGDNVWKAHQAGELTSSNATKEEDWIIHTLSYTKDHKLTEERLRQALGYAYF